MEQTLVLLKPSAVTRALVGVIISRYERAGLTIDAMTLGTYSRTVFEDLYAEHEGKPFYEPIVSWMSAQPIVAIVLAGDDAVQKTRSLNGATDPLNADPGTIRGDLAHSLHPDNLVHASDSVASAKRELPLFFSDLAVRS